MSFSSLEQRARVLTLALFVFLSINKVNSQSRVPSPSDAVCEPTFELRDGRTLVSGKASAVRLASGRVVLITVMHSFGPAGGLNAVIPPESLPELVSQTILSDPQTGQEVGRTGAELLSTGDGYPPDADYSKDLAAFDLNPGYRRRVFSLYPSQVRVGTRCWLITYTNGHEPRAVSAVVVESSPLSLIIKLNQNINTQATSGSPVFAETGEMVGMSRGHDDAGRIFCNPSFRIKQRLESELGTK
jgi:uncharacterized protein affecting Mg2+/Co2+ transport